MSLCLPLIGRLLSLSLLGSISAALSCLVCVPPRGLLSRTAAGHRAYLSLSAVLDTCTALPPRERTFLERGPLGTWLVTSALKTHSMHHQSICHLSFSRYATQKAPVKVWENSRKLWKYSLVSTALLVLSNVPSLTWKLFKARNPRQVNIVPRVSMSEVLQPEIERCFKLKLYSCFSIISSSKYIC